MSVYHPPIPSWLIGLEGRMKSHGVRLPPALSSTLRKDFSWFALNYLRDPTVGVEAKRAFIYWFVGDTTPAESSVPPPPDFPSGAWDELKGEAARMAYDDAKWEDQDEG